MSCFHQWHIYDRRFPIFQCVCAFDDECGCLFGVHVTIRIALRRILLRTFRVWILCTNIDDGFDLTMGLT